MCPSRNVICELDICPSRNVICELDMCPSQNVICELDMNTVILKLFHWLIVTTCTSVNESGSGSSIHCLLI